MKLVNQLELVLFLLENHKNGRFNYILVEKITGK